MALDAIPTKTLQRARARLQQAGFMRVFCEPGDRRGNTYGPDFERMRVEARRLRSREQIAPEYPGAFCSPHQSYPSGSNFQIACGEKLASAADTATEAKE